MIKKLLILNLCLMSACAFAETNAYDAMQKFLESRKYNIGFDAKTKRIAAIGVSEFTCTDMKDSIFTRQRMLYMKIAVLNAKADIIKNISSNISAQEEYKSAYKSDSKLGDLSKESFKSQVSCLTAMPLKGMITLNHAESYNAASKKYQIAVAVGWSAKSEAYALGTQRPPKRPNKKPGTVREWLKQNKKAYGSRTFIDKDGQIWFLGIAQYPLGRGHSIAKSFASLEAQAIVNYSLYSDIASREKAAQLMKNSDDFKGKSKSRIIETLVKSINQSVKNAKSKAVMLSIQEVTPEISGVKHLAVAYGYAPEIKELKKVAKKMPAGGNTAANAVGDDGYVISFGTGMDRGSATRDALIEAIKMVNGAAMQSSAEMQQKFANATTKLDDMTKNKSVSIETMQKKVREKTRGLIENYSVISITKSSASRWEAKLKVKVFKFDPSNIRGKGFQVTIVTLPTVCEEANKVYKVGKEKRMSAADIAVKIQNYLDAMLADSNKFTVIDRANLAKVLREQAMSIRMARARLMGPKEIMKIGHHLSADYLVISKFDSCKYYNKAKFDPKSGRVKRLRKFSLTLELKVISGVNSDTLLSKKAKVKLTSDEIKSIESKEESLIEFATAKALKPFIKEFIKLKGSDKKAKMAGIAYTLPVNPPPRRKAANRPAKAAPVKPRAAENSQAVKKPIKQTHKKVTYKEFVFKVKDFKFNKKIIYGIK